MPAPATRHDDGERWREPRPPDTVDYFDYDHEYEADRAADAYERAIGYDYREM